MPYTNSYSSNILMTLHSVPAHTHTNTHTQRIKEELAAEEERKFRENAAAEAEIR